MEIYECVSVGWPGKQALVGRHGVHLALITGVSAAAAHLWGRALNALSGVLEFWGKQLRRQACR